MASRKKKTSAASKRRKKRGSSPLARMAKSKGMTIAQLKRAVPACGKWSVRRRKPSRKKPCR